MCSGTCIFHPASAVMFMSLLCTHSCNGSWLSVVYTSLHRCLVTVSVEPLKNLLAVKHYRSLSVPTNSKGSCCYAGHNVTAQRWVLTKRGIRLWTHCKGLATVQETPSGTECWQAGWRKQSEFQKSSCSQAKHSPFVRDLLSFLTVKKITNNVAFNPGMEGLDMDTRAWREWKIYILHFAHSVLARFLCPS